MTYSFFGMLAIKLAKDAHCNGETVRRKIENWPASGRDRMLTEVSDDFLCHQVRVSDNAIGAFGAWDD